MINYRLFILVPIVLFSCKENKPHSLKVNYSHYQLWLHNLDTVDLKDSATLILQTLQKEGRKKYELKPSLKDSVANFTYSIHGDSLFYQNLYCMVFDTIELKHKETIIPLFISHFDEINVSDEESYVFWNTTNGVLGEYNYEMGPVLLFEPINLPGFSKTLYQYIVEREKASLMK